VVLDRPAARGRDAPAVGGLLEEDAVAGVEIDLASVM
jgi:hypothetical protein